jgi:hypothetical protein
LTIKGVEEKTWCFLYFFVFFKIYYFPWYYDRNYETPFTPNTPEHRAMKMACNNVDNVGFFVCSPLNVVIVTNDVLWGGK